MEHDFIWYRADNGFDIGLGCVWFYGTIVLECKFLLDENCGDIS